MGTRSGRIRIREDGKCRKRRKSVGNDENVGKEEKCRKKEGKCRKRRKIPADGGTRLDISTVGKFLGCRHIPIGKYKAKPPEAGRFSGVRIS